MHRYLELKDPVLKTFKIKIELFVHFNNVMLLHIKDIIFLLCLLYEVIQKECIFVT